MAGSVLHIWEARMSGNVGIFDTQSLGVKPRIAFGPLLEAGQLAVSEDLPKAKFVRPFRVALEFPAGAGPLVHLHMLEGPDAFGN
jgi:hypothetical protein